MLFQRAFLQNARQHAPNVRQGQQAQEALHVVVERHMGAFQLETFDLQGPDEALNPEAFPVSSLNPRH